MSKASLIILSSGSLWLSACSVAVDAPRDPPPRTVLVSRVEAPASAADVVIGTVRSARMDVVSAEQGGRIVALFADVGDRVSAGQLLARLDSGASDLRLDVANADLARVTANAAERARHAERMRQLVADGTASTAELDAALAEATAAEAAQRSAAAQASLARRETRMALLRAPSSGVVAARPATLSAVLAGGAPVFEIEGAGERLIGAALPAAVAARLQPGARAAFRYDGVAGEARLLGISARDNGAGGREASFVVVTGAPAPGAMVDLALPGQAPAFSASVPQSAVLETRDGSRKVRVIGAGNRLRDVPVRLLGLAGAQALVEGKLSPGDLVVAAGGEFLEAGLRVQPHVAGR